MTTDIYHIAKVWHTAIGDSNEFSIESRIFHGVVLISSSILIINGFTSLLLGLTQMIVFTFGFIPILWFCYYLSRFCNKNKLAILIFGLVSVSECIACYFFCAGSAGTTLLLILAITFILGIISPKQQVKFWLLLNSAVLFILLYAEYRYPESIHPMYENNQLRLIDYGQSYFMMFVFVALVTGYLKGNYYYEKHKAEEREAELVTLNETKNKLFSIVAHDLRAPLASVQNYLELLKKVYLTDEERGIIQDQLLNSTKSTSQMLTNILSWTKAQMDGVSLNFVRFNLNRVLQNTMQVQFNLAKEKGITLNYLDKSDMLIVADPDMMQLVIRNLLNNAIKFTPSGGNVSVVYKQNEEECMIIISDTGIGISEAQQVDIFSLKSKSTFGTNNERGVGLGLVLTKSYVELQNGKIWFETEEGKGTTFFLSFSNR